MVYIFTTAYNAEKTLQHLADINGDGSVNVFDIDPFVAVLTGG